MIIYRPGQRLIYLDPAIRVSSPPLVAPAANWWEPTTGSFTVVVAYQPKGAASLAESYSNLANPGTFDAAPGVAPTWDAVSGWIYNGTTQYLTTGIVPVNNQQWTMLIQFSNTTVVGSFDTVGGVAQGAGGPWILIQPYRNNTDVRYGNGGLLAVGPVLSAGNVGISGAKGYRNGTADAGTVGVAAGTFTHALYIACLNNFGTASSFFKGNIQAVAIYSTTLDPTQVAEISTAMSLL